MIGHIYLQNFKCFREETLPLSRLTILSGGNGVGKSSVIQSLLLLRQTGDQVRRLTGAARSAPDLKVTVGVKLNDEYSLCLGNSTTLTNADIESDIVVLEVANEERQKETAIRCSFEASTTKPATSIPCIAGIDAPEDLLDWADSLSIFQPEFHYLIAERVGPRDLQPVADQDFLSTGFAGEFTAFAIAQAEVQSRTVGEALRLTQGSDIFRVQLEAWMGSLIPGTQIFSRPFTEFNRVQMSVARRGASVPPLPPANTGFGISYSLPVVVSGLLAPPGSMFIVENPEAHLHPGAQTAMGIFLAHVAAAGVQVLVETHSENVLNGVRLASLRNVIGHEDALFLFLSLAEGATQPALHPITMNRAAELTKWPPGFFDQQGADLAEMMRARRGIAATVRE